MLRKSLLKYAMAAFFAIGLVLPIKPALAEYPEKPISLVVGFSAGGGTDTYARTLSSLIQEHLGVPMVVVNKPGAAGMIAAKFVAEQPSDGYTLYMASAGSLLVKYLYDPAGSPVNPKEDFKTLGMAGASIPGLLVPENSPFKSTAELVAYAKDHPGELRWSHPGRGSLFQLTGEAFLEANGITAQDIPFKGGSNARNAVASGQVDFGFMGVQLGKGFESQTNVLGVAGDSRDEANPDVATFLEQDLPVVRLINPQIVVAPRDIPAENARKLIEAIKRTVESEKYRNIMLKAGLSPIYMWPDEADTLLTGLQETLQPVIDRTRN